MPDLMETKLQPVNVLTGTVVHGKQLGRRLGYPTANLNFDTPQGQLPSPGVYAATATLADGRQFRAMVNIGYRPTVDPEGMPMSVEAHLCNFEGDLYGQTIRLDFGPRIRDERRMSSLDELREQLARDLESVKSITL